MRLWKFLARGMTASLMLFVAGMLAFTSVGCAEETFKCCQCKYPCTDAKGAPIVVCDCSKEFTYEECGTLCHETLPPALEAQGITGCQPPTNALALDGC